jgi:hypothetical protein
LNRTRVALATHADWSVNPKKRWLARAVLTERGGYRAFPPEPVGDTGSLLARLKRQAGEGSCILLGFDFPIGVPLSYAREAGIGRFLDWLPALGSGKWSQFYRVAEKPDEIGVLRPFYPHRPGGARRDHLVQGLGVDSFNDLRRVCERAHPGRGAASPLFWTLGAQQVGKAAISGWREVLQPGLQDEPHDLRLWPFCGELSELIQPERIIAAETYPREVYTHLGLEFSPRQAGRPSGKRSYEDRAANGPRLISWAGEQAVELVPELLHQIETGFGNGPQGEDPFDALVGLFGVLNVLIGGRPPGEPQDESLRDIEGWILGQQ